VETHDITSRTRAGVGEVRFSRPSGFWSPRGGGAAITEMVFRPMNERQFEVTEIGLTKDAPSEPAPLEFGVWTAQFRDMQDAARASVAVITTRGEVAATLSAPTSGEDRVERSKTGLVVLTARAGAYGLIVHARHDGELGRQRLALAVRPFATGPAVSDLLLARVWDAAPDAVERDTMLARVERRLRFGGGDTVRTYAEVYDLQSESGVSRYRATYLLLKTSDPERDAAQAEWPDAVRFEFDRRRAAGAMAIETLDIEPRWLPEGSYLLRLEIYDLVADVGLRPATIMFRVGD